MAEPRDSDRDRIRSLPAWDGDPETFAAIQEALEDALALTGTAGIVPKLNPLDLPAPKDKAESIKFNAKCWVYLSAVLSKVGRTHVITTYEANRDKDNTEPVISKAVADIAVEAGGSKHLRSAARLWEATLAFSCGEQPAVAGEDFLRSISALQFASTGTWEERTKAVLATLDNFVLTAKRLDNSDFAFSDFRACHQFRQIMPRPFLRLVDFYENIDTMAALRRRAIRDAKRFDSNDMPDGQAAELLAALGITSTGDGNAQADPAIVLSALRNAVNGNGNANGNNDRGHRNSTKGSRRRRLPEIPKKRLKDRSAGPPFENGLWCDHHFWCHHQTADCKNPAETPAGDDSDNTPLYKRNSDGTFSKLSGNDRQQLGLCATVIDKVALTTGIKLSDYWIIDTGAEVDLDRDAANLAGAQELDGSMTLDGANDGDSTRLTHSGPRHHDLGNLSYSVTAYGPSKYNIASASGLAKAGISLVIDSRDPTAPRMLLYRNEPTGTAVVEAIRMGGLFVLPRTTPTSSPTAAAGVIDGSPSAGVPVDPIVAPAGLPATGVPIGTKPLIDFHATGTTSPGVKSALQLAASQAIAMDSTTVPPCVRDYASFRLRFGGGTHRRTMTRAKQLGVTLSDASNGVRRRLDSIQRLANAKALALKPVKNIGSGYESDASIEHIIADTMGNKLNRSATGNRSAIVFVRKSDPPGVYHVSCNPDHSSATAAGAFQEFVKFRGIPVLREAMSQPVEFFSDGGSEWKGCFKQMLDRGGIKHNVSVAYKSASGSQSYAESAIALAQQDMRRQTLSARAAFAAIGLNSDDYYDFCLVYMGLSSLRYSEAARNIISEQQLDRAIPAPWGTGCEVTVPAKHPLNSGVVKQHALRAVRGVLLGARGSLYSILTADGTVFNTPEVKFDASFSNDLPAAKAEPTVSPTILDLVADDIDKDGDTGHNHSTSAGGSTNTVITMPDRFGTGELKEHDRVSVFWPEESAQFDGVISNIDRSGVDYAGGSFTVEYDDGDVRTHPITDVPDLEVVGLTATRGNRTVDPRIEHCVVVQPDGTYDIKPDLLNGITTYTPPELGVIRQEDLPTEPRGMSAALSSNNALAPWCLAAAIKEYRGHAAPPGRQPMFDLVDEISEAPPMREVWVFRYKTVNGVLDKVKARCTCDGSSGQRHVSFHESYVGVAPVDDVRRLENLALQLGWLSGELDWVQAFCQHRKVPRPDGSSSLILPSAGNRIFAPSGRPYKKRQVSELYGDGQAGYTHTRKATDSIMRRNQPPGVPLNPFVMERSPHQPTIFKTVFDPDGPYSGEHLILYLHNDNLRSWTSSWPAYLEFRTWARQRWELTGSDIPLQQQQPQELLGMTVTYKPDSVSLNMPGYVKSILSTFNMTKCKPSNVPMVPGTSLSKLDYPTSESERIETRHKVAKMFGVRLTNSQELRNFYAKIVSSIGWVARQTAPILLLAHSMLGRVMADPSVKAFKAAQLVLRYLSTRTDIGLTYVRQREYVWRQGDWPEYLMESDASFADDPANLRSTGAYLGYYRGCAADTASSAQHKTVTTSTLHSESTSATTAAKQGAYVKHVHDWLGVTKRDAIPLAIDNLATVLATAGPIPKFSAKSKHFAISARYTAELVEQGVIRPYHVGGSVTADHPGLPADALTKPLNARLIAHYSSIIQGPPSSV